jgi:hypothetical protein
VFEKPSQSYSVDEPKVAYLPPSPDNPSEHVVIPVKAFCSTANATLRHVLVFAINSADVAMIVGML